MASTKQCPTCKAEKEMCEFESKKKKEPTKLCQQCRKDDYAKNREQHLQRRRTYYENNREKILEKLATVEEKAKRNERNKQRRQVDPAFRIAESLKVRIHEILSTYKDTTTNYLLGATKLFIKMWLEYQFDENMSWDNFATYWNIDHVIPVSFFKITEKSEQMICFHWTNLRPLSKLENIKKFNRIKPNDILTHVETLRTFVKTNVDYQECFEKSIWPRLELGYGNNVEDKDSFTKFLKSVIRSEVP